MNIGIAFDLRADYLKEGYDEVATAEFESEETIAGLEWNLQKLGYKTERIGNARSVMRALLDGRRWDLVFNICEGMYGFGREALVPALLDNFQVPYTFSDPLVLGLALHKPTTKRILHALGILTPEFAVVDVPGDISGIRLPFPLFAKPAAEGMSKGIDSSCKVESPEALRTVCLRLLEEFHQPVLVERFLPGREFTAGVIGTGMDAELVGVMEVILRSAAEQNAYSYKNKENFEKLVQYRPAEAEVIGACAAVVLPVWRALGCRDAGRLDLKMDEQGQIQFLEINPLAGLNEVRSDLPILCRMNGIGFMELIGRIVQSAEKRIPRQ